MSLDEGKCPHCGSESFDYGYVQPRADEPPEARCKCRGCQRELI